jgi:DNA-binding transcriptional LysR family regulator
VRRHQLTPLLPWRSTEFAYYLVTRPGERDNPRVMALRTWLLEEIGDYAEHIRNTFALTLT